MSDFGDLAAAVADAFDLGDPVGPMVEVASGEQARIWRLDTARGRYAVKEPRDGVTPRVDGIDIAFQEAVRAQTDVRMPMPVRRSGGAYVVPIQGRSVRVSAWEELAASDPSLDPAAVGALIAELHRVDFDPPAADRLAGVDPWFWAPVGRAMWQRLIDRLTLAAAPFAATLRAELPHLLALEALLEAPSDVRMCHRDLWADNLLATPTGELCVVDWDSCGLADPSHELACAVFEFGQWSAERMRALYDAYRGGGGPATLERAGQCTMLIAQFGHFWEAAAEEWLDPDSSAAKRSHAEDRVAELMEPPLRVADVERLIAAVHP